jgi:uncharacterized membrane protein
VPLGITLWVLVFLITLFDQVIVLLPERFRPEALVGYHIPLLGSLLGLVLSVAIVLITGVVAATFFGARLIRLWEALLGRIPVVKSIYSSVKQVSDTLLSDSGNAFRKALLIEYPYRGSLTIAFQTGSPAAAVANTLSEEHVSVYIPTTPNPTSGFFLMLPRSRVHEIDMSVEEALKYIISMGVVAPRPHVGAAAPGTVPIVTALEHRN